MYFHNMTQLFVLYLFKHLRQSTILELKLSQKFYSFHINAFIHGHLMFCFSYKTFCFYVFASALLRLILKIIHYSCQFLFISHVYE